MALFNYDDTVKVKANGPISMRPGVPASVVGITKPRERSGDYLKTFSAADGIVYLIEFEGGDAIEVPEALWEKGKFPSEM